MTLTSSSQPQSQRASFTVKGKKNKLSAEIEVTSFGLIAIGVLVSSILVSTALLVKVAQRDHAVVADDR